MNKTILSYIEECEAWKVAIKSLHWDSASLSQHELCDDIASDISDFEDLVSEVEQSMSGKLPINTLKPKNYKIKSLKSFVEDVISSTQAFLKNLEKMGKKYVGIKSECETFIGVMQRKLYLVNFTLKEDLKKRIRASINESRPKSITPETEFEKLRGRKPKSIKTRINHIYKIISMYGIDRKRYTDENWQAVDDYRSAISSLGCDVEIKPCANLANSDSIESDGGYCDYDPTDNMPRSKQYAIKITYGDGMVIDGYIKCMACGTMSDPFSTYDTCIVLWPKSNNKLTENNMRIDERKLKRILHECTVKALRRILKEEGIDDYDSFYRSDFPEGKQGDIDYSWYMNDRNRHIDRDVNPRFNDRESRSHPYSEYFQNNSPYANERLYTLNRLDNRDSFGSWADNDNAYYSDGSTFPSADYVDGNDNYKYKV